MTLKTISPTHFKFSKYNIPPLQIILTLIVICQAAPPHVPVSDLNSCFHANTISAAAPSAVGTITSTFANSYTINNTNYHVLRGLINLQYSPVSNTIGFRIIVGAKTFTSVSFIISTNTNSTMLRYTVRYMIIDVDSFGVDFDFNQINFTNFVLKPGTNNFTQAVDPNVKSGQFYRNGNTPYIYCVIVMLEMIDATTSNTFPVSMTCTKVNPAKIQVEFIYVTKANYTLVGINTMVMDKTDIQSLVNVTLQYQSMDFYKNNPTSFISQNAFAMTMKQQSSFLGLKAFNSIATSKVRFDIFMDFTNQIVSISNTSNITQFFYHFDYFNIKNKFYSCPTSYPYQLGTNISGVCYSSIPAGYYYNVTQHLLEPSFCPQGQFINATDIRCYYCYYTCMECIYQSNCTSCNSSNNRVFDNSTGQCDPMPGFYDAGIPSAQPCPSGCTSCLNATFCLSCNSSAFLTLSNNTCVAIPGYYLIPGDITALPCNNTCLTCSSLLTCTSCNDSLHRTLNTSTGLCQPSPGYYQAGIPQAAPCSIGCLLCLNETICLQCNTSTNRVLENGSCVAAPGYYTINSTVVALLCGVNCITCINNTFCILCVNNSPITSGVCFSCPSTEYEVNGTCVPCNTSLSNCLTCSSSTACLSCISTSYSVNPTTLQCVYKMCGDGQLQFGEECDDGNTNSNDGCSDCQIQTYWTCTNSSPSVCSYIGVLNIQVKNLFKQDDTNSLMLILGIDSGTTNMNNYLNRINFNDVVQINGETTTVNSLNYQPDSGTIQLIVDYNSDLRGTNIEIQFNPASSNLSALALQSSSKIFFPASAQNNLEVSYYPDNVYAFAKVIKSMSTAVGILFLLLFAAALIFGKIIGLEAAAVAQFAFLSLMCLKNMSPAFAALSKGLIACIYTPLSSDPRLDSTTADYVRGINLYSQFSLNFIIDLVLIIVPILLGFVLWILWKTVLAKKAEKLKPWVTTFLFQYTFHLILFSGYLGFSTGIIEFYLGAGSSQSTKGASLAFCVIFFLLVITYTVLFVKKRLKFGEYKTFFNPDKGTIYVLLITIADRGGLGILAPVMASTKFNYSQTIFILLFLFYAIGILIKKPYNIKRHNFRQILNILISILIQLLYQMSKVITDPNHLYHMYGPLIVLILLLICLIYNVVMLIIELKIQCKKTYIEPQNLLAEDNDLAKKPSDKQEEDSFLKKTRASLLYSSAIRPFGNQSVQKNNQISSIKPVNDGEEVEKPRHGLEKLNQSAESSILKKLTKGHLQSEKLKIVNVDKTALDLVNLMDLEDDGSI